MTRPLSPPTSRTFPDTDLPLDLLRRALAGGLPVALLDLLLDRIEAAR